MPTDQGVRSQRVSTIPRYLYPEKNVRLLCLKAKRIRFKGMRFFRLTRMGSRNGHRVLMHSVQFSVFTLLIHAPNRKHADIARGVDRCKL